MTKSEKIFVLTAGFALLGGALGWFLLPTVLPPASLWLAKGVRIQQAVCELGLGPAWFLSCVFGIALVFASAPLSAAIDGLPQALVKRSFLYLLFAFAMYAGVLSSHRLLLLLHMGSSGDAQVSASGIRRVFSETAPALAALVGPVTALLLRAKRGDWCRIHSDHSVRPCDV